MTRRNLIQVDVDLDFDMKSVEKMAREHLKRHNAEVNKRLTRVHQTYAGKNPSLVRPQIRRALKGSHLEGDSKTLERFTRAVAAGQPVEVRS